MCSICLPSSIYQYVQVAAPAPKLIALSYCLFVAHNRYNGYLPGRLVAVESGSKHEAMSFGQPDSGLVQPPKRPYVAQRGSEIGCHSI